MLYIVNLEPMENRYTRQWSEWFKEEFPDSIQISGTLQQVNENSKNFLDPNATNIWKSEQIIEISKLFQNKKIQTDDKFLFLDGWHYGVIATRYMAFLNNIDVKIYAIWHAGSYDPGDLLSGAEKQFKFFENSLFENINKSFVATNFHKQMIDENYYCWDRCITTGLPYKFDHLDKYKKTPKGNMVIFPHRLSDEKQVFMLEEIEPILNKCGINVIYCQRNRLTKKEYHSVLAQSKLCFSASLQETWGIGTFEGLYLGVIPCVPNRLSYTEMYVDDFKYPEIWTSSNDNFKKHKNNLIGYIVDKIYNYDKYVDIMKSNMDYIQDKYCTFKNIKKEIGC